MSRKPFVAALAVVALGAGPVIASAQPLPTVKGLDQQVKQEFTQPGYQIFFESYGQSGSGSGGGTSGADVLGTDLAALSPISFDVAVPTASVPKAAAVTRRINNRVLNEINEDSTSVRVPTRNFADSEQFRVDTGRGSRVGSSGDVNVPAPDLSDVPRNP